MSVFVLCYVASFSRRNLSLSYEQGTLFKYVRGFVS